MIQLVFTIICKGVKSSPTRVGIMLFAVLGSIIAYTVLGIALSDMAVRAVSTWRLEWPFDMVVIGADVFSIQDQVQQIPGVKIAEKTSMLEILMPSGVISAMVPLENSAIYSLKHLEGRAPEHGGEISLPSSLARAKGVQIGDTISILPMQGNWPPEKFVVSGILDSKIGIPPIPILHADAIARVTAMPEATNALICLLDGKVDSARVEQAIKSLTASVTVRQTAQYDGVSSGLTLAGIMIASLRFVIVIVLGSSLISLFYMSQKEKAYECGVLRALGFTRLWLMLPPLFEGIAVLMLASILGTVLLLALVPVLTTAGNVSVRDLIRPIAAVNSLGLAVIAVSIFTQAFKPITRLLKDPWGKD
ncbi:MAG: ABC transporter permease protein [Bacillota bacterium]|nr:MAG: ABC transporter permease protein [Bacillota bacterium]